MRTTHDTITLIDVNYKKCAIEYMTDKYTDGYVCFVNRVALNTVVKALTKYARERGKANYEDVLIDRIFEVEEKCSRQLITTFQFNAK
jgi:hypothetical protein